MNATRSPVVIYKVFWQTYAWTRFVQRSHLAPDESSKIYFIFVPNSLSENKLECILYFTDLSESAAPFCVPVLGQDPQLHVMYTAKANSFISQT